MKKVKYVLKQLELAFRKLILSLLQRSGEGKPFDGTPLQLPSNPKILFLRQDRIGDAIVTTPLLVAVRERFPKAQITMLLGKNNQAILSLLPIDCNAVVYKKSLLEDRTMLAGLRKQKFDVAIDLTDNASVTSSILISKIKPRYAIGIEKENGVVYDILVPRLERSVNHISRRIAELLRPLGIDPESVDPQPRLKVDRQVTIKGRLGINISAGTESRWAPESVYAEIAKEALTSGRWPEIVILAEPRDAEKAEAIATLASHAAIRVLPPTKSYGDFASNLSSCEALITPDTSVVHLAAALNIPQVVIYAPIPVGLHYWTPSGVLYEMMVQSPNLASLEPPSVIALLRKLETRLAAPSLESSSVTHAR